jgi:DNA-binding protein H-NS
MDMNLGQHSVPDLIKLHHEIEQELRKRHASDPETTEYHLRNLADEWGTAVADLLDGSATRQRAAARPARLYQHPLNPRLTWDGTGAKPPWVRQWEVGGHKLSELEIQPNKPLN